MKTYNLQGTFRMGRLKARPFEMEVSAKDEAAAKEKVFSLLGSRHKCKKRFIKIESVKAV
jgi:large subunit ribosomal protein LX